MSKTKTQKNGAPTKPAAPQTVSKETVLAAQLHEARMHAAHLDAELAQALAANAQLATENARLMQAVSRANVAAAERENEKLREDYKLPMGKTLQRDADGNYFWVDTQTAQQAPAPQAPEGASQG